MTFQYTYFGISNMKGYDFCFSLKLSGSYSRVSHGLATSIYKKPKLSQFSTPA